MRVSGSVCVTHFWLLQLYKQCLHKAALREMPLSIQIWHKSSNVFFLSASTTAHLAVTGVLVVVALVLLVPLSIGLAGELLSLFPQQPYVCHIARLPQSLII